MSAAPPKKLKRSVAGKSSKKNIWRKLYDTHASKIESDVYDCIAKRLVQESQLTTKKRIPEKGNNSGQGEELFRVDDEGLSKLNRRLQNELKHIDQNTTQYSKYHLEALTRIRKSDAARNKADDFMNAKRKASEQIVDIWTSDNSNTNKNKRGRPERWMKHGSIPALVLPSSGQSINPEYHKYRDVVLAAAAVVVEKDRKEEEFHRNFTPITNDLIDALPEDIIQALTFVEKQKVYRYLSSLPVSDVDRWNKALHYISDVLPKEASRIHDAETDVSDDMENNQKIQVAVYRIPKSRKAESARKRFKLHCIQVKEAAIRRQEKEFRHSINYIKKFISDLKNDEEKKKALHVYNQAIKKAYAEAEKKQFCIKYRCGKYYFENPCDNVILPSSMQSAQGSLRRLPLREMKGASIKDRIASIYRRRLTEPVHSQNITYQSLCRARRLAHWKLKARKTRIKI